MVGFSCRVSSSDVAVTPLTTPGAPQSVAARTATTTGINVTWRPPSSNGGSPITGYQVYRTTSGGAAVTTAVACTSTSCTFADTTTTSGVYYSYKVLAINAAGAGKYSYASTARAR